MSRWELLLPMLLLAGCVGAATESPAESAAPPVEETPAFAPAADLGEPTITMGAAKVGQAVRLRVDAPGAAEPVDYLWRIVGTEGETVLAGKEVSYTPLTPTDHAVSVEVHDAYDREARAEATMPVGIA